MKQDQRQLLDRALRRARLTAYPPGEFVGQESFMRAAEIRSLAVRAGIAPGASVLDVCCGVAGPGRFVTSELGCSYLGVDESADAVGLARRRAAGLPCRFEVARVPPLPPGRFDVVLLLETMLAFADKAALLRAVASAVRPGGRFAFTVEEGRALNQDEAQTMPHADTVCLVTLPDLFRFLDGAGFRVRWLVECTASHRATVDALLGAFVADQRAIVADIGRAAMADLLDSHRLWSRWLREGRVRKFAVVAQSAARIPRNDEPRGSGTRSAS